MSFNRVSVLIPTRGRIDRLTTLLESYHATVSGRNSELIFRCDQDDLDTQAFLQDQKRMIRLVSGPRLGGYRSLPVFFNELADAAKGDILMLGNDDMIFRTSDWPSYLISAANRFPDGVFDLGVHTLNEDHYPFATVSRMVVQQLGFIVDPAVFWGDIYLRDIMLHFGRAIMVPQVEIVHDWAGFKPDRTFNDGTRDPVAADQNYWSHVHALAVTRGVSLVGRLYDQHLCASTS